MPALASSPASSPSDDTDTDTLNGQPGMQMPSTATSTANEQRRDVSVSLALSVSLGVCVWELFGRRKRPQLHLGPNRQIINVKPGETWPLWLMGLKLFKLHALLNT